MLLFEVETQSFAAFIKRLEYVSILHFLKLHVSTHKREAAYRF